MASILAALVLLGGLHGTVMRGPITPVCMVGRPCSAPAQGVVLLFARRGRVVTRARTDVHGRYAVRLRAGVYSVRLRGAPRIGRGLEPRRVRVRAGRSRLLAFTIDTGIR